MKFVYDINTMSEVFGTSTPEELVKKIKDYFHVAGIDVEVTAAEDSVSVELPSTDEASTDAEFSAIAGLCQQGKFKQAEPLLDDFIEHHPATAKPTASKPRWPLRGGQLTTP